MNTEIIKQIVENVNLNDPKSVKSAARKIIESAVDFSSGAGVVLCDENGASGCPNSGVAGKIKGPSSKGAGWYDVEFPDGSVQACQADLLLPI
jgi:hypothetical protein